MTFSMKTSETKKIVKIFCEAFLIFFLIFCFNHPGLIFIFIKKGFLNSQAVRIRANVLLTSNDLGSEKKSHVRHRFPETLNTDF
jgi:hypothetical protein